MIYDHRLALLVRLPLSLVLPVLSSFIRLPNALEHHPPDVTAPCHHHPETS
jgi:hypothetical protein